MIDQIRRDVRLLKGYALFSTAVIAVLVLAAFRQPLQKTRFGEIDVERINVIEPDGRLRMVLSNRPRSPGPIYKGKPFGYKGGGRPGMIFFNDEGTENGGLTFTGSRAADGTYSAASHFSFDQFNQDQVFYFDYADENGRRRNGLTIADRADVDIGRIAAAQDSLDAIADTAARRAAMMKLITPANGEPSFAPRIYLGRAVNKSAILFMADTRGRPRLRMMVDSLGAASLEFLDEAGRVTSRLPGR